MSGVSLAPARPGEIGRLDAGVDDFSGWQHAGCKL